MKRFLLTAQTILIVGGNVLKMDLLGGDEFVRMVLVSSKVEKPQPLQQLNHNNSLKNPTKQSELTMA